MSGRPREDDRGGGAFAVECPGCHAHVSATRGSAGRVAGCPRCHAPFIVPVPLAEERHPAPHDADPGPVALPPSAAETPPAFVEPPPPSTLRRDAPAAVETVPVATALAAPESESAGADLAAALSAGFAVPERPKTIRSGGVEIEIRRLTPEERRTRRARRNLVMLVVGAAVLVALVVILGKGGR